MKKVKNSEFGKLIVDINSQSAISEQFRSIRTSIELSLGENQNQVLVVTSSDQNSGKSLVSSNLALTFAQKGKKTLLIDADMRNSSINKYFYVPSKFGLSSIIKQTDRVEELICTTKYDNLFVLPAGITPPNPADLLGSSYMEELILKLREEFDHIIIDTPPVLAVADAIVLSVYSDGIILVVRSGVTKKQNAKKTLRLLRQSSTPIVGSILNDVKLVESDYYYQKK